MSLQRIFTLTLIGLGAFGGIASAEDAMVPPNNAPANWTCDPQWYEDGVCDCGCTVPDRDCPRGPFNVCERSGCAEGQVPWEHRPYSCMRSACGDGWLDEFLGEICDDGEALNSGGCSADCGEVNPGWICGVRADGCESDGTKPLDMMMPVADAFVPEDMSLELEMQSFDMEASSTSADTDEALMFPDAGGAANDGGCMTGFSNSAAGAGACMLLLLGLALRRGRVQR